MSKHGNTSYHFAPLVSFHSIKKFQVCYRKIQNLWATGWILMLGAFEGFWLAPKDTCHVQYTGVLCIIDVSDFIRTGGFSNWAVCRRCGFADTLKTPEWRTAATGDESETPRQHTHHTSKCVRNIYIHCIQFCMSGFKDLPCAEVVQHIVLSDTSSVI